MKAKFLIVVNENYHHKSYEIHKILKCLYKSLYTYNMSCDCIYKQCMILNILNNIYHLIFQYTIKDNRQFLYTRFPQKALSYLSEYILFSDK